jgi:4-hydroxy-tetrahydrodipicolinate synthase
MTAPFTGVGVALATVFDAHGEVDVEGTAGHARRLVDAGMRAVVVAGSTGEAAALDPAERVTLLRAVSDSVGGDAVVVAGTGAPSARQAAAYTRDAREAGASTVLTLSPPGSRDLAAYYGAVAEAARDATVLAYHFPAASQPGIPVADLARLPVAGLKDSSGDPGRLLEELTTYDGLVYVGAAPHLALAGPVGATGAILALANLEPELCAQAFEGDAKAQLALAPHHLAIHGRGPVALKTRMAERFGLSPVTRLS